MYRNCATELSAQHQKMVTDALLELMRKMPYEDITVTQLCQTAGVTRRVFYHLFSNKTGALHALIDNTIFSFDHYGEDVSDALLRFFRYWKAQRQFLDVLRKNDFSGLLLERLIARILAEDFDVRYWLRRNGWHHHDREAIIFGFTGLMGLVYSWYDTGYQQTEEEMAAVVRLMLHPQFIGK